MGNNQIDQIRDYIEKVHEAFNKHCDEIETETVKKLEEAGKDKEIKKDILSSQKEQLDKTLAELKTVLGEKTKELRDNLENTEKQKFEEEFDLNEELSTIN